MGRSNLPADKYTLPPNAAAIQPILVDEKTAAAMLGVSPRTLFDLNDRGDVPARQMPAAPGRKLYHVDDLLRFACQLPAYRKSSNIKNEKEDSK